MSKDEKAKKEINKMVDEVEKELKDGGDTDIKAFESALYQKFVESEKKVNYLEEDDDYLKVLGYVTGKEFVTISELQKKFNIGYARAGAYIDDFENKGYIAPADGSRQRKVIITLEEFNEKRNKNKK